MSKLFCRHAFGVLCPLRAALRKELGEQLLSTGLVGAAMGLFEEEELPQAQQLVQARLQVCYLYVTVFYLYITCLLPVCYALLQKLPHAQQLVQASLQVTGACMRGDIGLLT